MATMTLNNPTRVAVRRTSSWQSLLDRAASSGDLETDLRRARQLAGWLDTKFSVAGIRFGVEGIIGLIPVIGDLAGALIGTYPIFLARRHNLGRAVQTRMAFNLATEWAIGSIPIVGDLFDIAFKANVRNVRLLERAVEKARLQAAAGVR